MILELFFLTIYRPPRYSGKFIDELTELLSVICTDYDSIIITGDLNIHVDNNMDNNAKDLSALLDTFGLLQHVKDPHTLEATPWIWLSQKVLTSPMLMLRTWLFLIFSVYSLTCRVFQIFNLSLCLSRRGT